MENNKYSLNELKTSRSENYTAMKVRRNQLLDELLFTCEEMEHLKGYDHFSITSQILDRLRNLKGATKNDN